MNTLVYFISLFTFSIKTPAAESVFSNLIRDNSRYDQSEIKTTNTSRTPASLDKNALKILDPDCKVRQFSNGEARTISAQSLIGFDKLEPLLNRPNLYKFVYKNNIHIIHKYCLGE